jgi:Concanavalin A-like lectin/glucanases superfamily
MKTGCSVCLLLVAGFTVACGPTHIDAVGLAPPTPASGPIAHWSFDQTGGTTLEDDSGNRRIGTISGATFKNDGQFGGALHFQRGNTVTVENFPDATPSWTFSAWIRISEEDGAADELGTAVSTEDFEKGGWEFQTYGRSSRVYWHFGYWIDPMSKYVHYECLCYDVGRWAHATVVRDAEANVINFYKDGVLDRSDPSPPPILPGTSMLLMGRWQQAGRLFAGSLDDVAIYQRALSATEVAELHQHPPVRPQ